MALAKGENMQAFLKNESRLLQLSNAIQEKDLELAKKLIQDGTDINYVFDIPINVNLEKFEYTNKKIGISDRVIDGTMSLVFDLATGKKKPKPVGLKSTLLNVYIALDKLESVEMALNLGANPLIVTTWIHDAFEICIQLRKEKSLDLLLNKVPFESLPKARQLSLITSLPRHNTNGNCAFGYFCELDSRLLDIGLIHKINFDMPIEKISMVKSTSISSLLQESLSSTEGLLVVEWLLKNNFGKTLSKQEILKRVDEINLKPSNCENKSDIAEKIKTTLTEN